MPAALSEWTGIGSNEIMIGRLSEFLEAAAVTIARPTPTLDTGTPDENHKPNAYWDLRYCDPLITLISGWARKNEHL